MSDIRTDVEMAFLKIFRDSEFLKKVPTIENTLRECLFSGDKFTAGFRGEELPAIAVSCQLQPMVDGVFTPGEKIFRIPVSITIVTRAGTKTAAAAAASELQDAVGYEVGQLRRSGNSLGVNTVVFGDVTCSATTVEEKPFHYAMSTTEFTVSKVVEL